MKLLVCVVFVSFTSVFAKRLHGKNIGISQEEVLTVFGHHLDPEENMNATEIIRYWGYPAEEYTVQTEDGYMIYIQRIPYGRNNSSKSELRPVVVLQHGLLGSATNWLTNLPEESLGFILADAGYDVWLGNMRGNTYGLRHKVYPVSSKEFWDFSFDEMAEYDLPAIVNKALSVSGQDQVSYIGHSQGTLVGFAKFSSDAEFSKKIKLFVALAPVVFVGDIKSPPLRILAPFSKQLALLFRVFGYRDFLPDYNLIRFFGRTFCEKKPIPVKVCENILFIMAGYDYQQTNDTRLDVYLSHTPAGTSTQNVFHFAQLVNSDKCQKFDYGSAAENKKHYGQSVPPQYPVADLTVPTALLYAENDWLATPKDVFKLKAKLGSVVETYKVPFPNWNHLDFIWGIDANKYVYPEVVKLVRKYTRDSN